jgi:hypothetical protein
VLIKQRRDDFPVKSIEEKSNVAQYHFLHALFATLLGLQDKASFLPEGDFLVFISINAFPINL